MSFFEWLGESYFPGNLGSVRRRYFRKRDIPRYRVIINFIIGTALVAAFYYFLISRRAGGISPEAILIVTLVFILYCIVSYYINPEPDYRNIGLGGTPIDHPFRISDDINRLLLIFKIILWPGYFIVRSTAEFYILLRYSGTRDMR
ncbi:MAG: hypothetical protein V2I37_10330 [Marinilabiliaceae bacterium]|jgi:hypothetical protein|nr:hypothetical protein [Marinilabiliaceae bacterium]